MKQFLGYLLQNTQNVPSVESQAIQLENTSAIVTTNLITDSATEETPAAVSHRDSINFASSSFRIRGVIFFLLLLDYFPQ